ncbi:MAG: phosphoribosylanthranilate isomerase [Planctomycetota bacterium]
MFQCKICGVRLEQDVVVVEDSGADAVGLNFFPPSVRYLDPEADSTSVLAESARRRELMVVGVFVNESIEFLRRVAEQVGLDAIQLHGDEPLEVAEQLIGAGQRVVRAVKIPRGPFRPHQLEELGARWRDVGCHLLLDVDAGSAHGGSGKTLHWESVRAWAKTDAAGDKWTLAGGLKPENLSKAMQTSGARSVDTASGVECPKGVKNAGRVRSFVEAFREATASDGSPSDEIAG